MTDVVTLLNAFGLTGVNLKQHNTNRRNRRSSKSRRVQGFTERWEFPKPGLRL